MSKIIPCVCNPIIISYINKKWTTQYYFEMFNSLTTFVATVATHQILRLTTFVATVAISISHVNNGERGARYAISVTKFESIVIIDDFLKVEFISK